MPSIKIIDEVYFIESVIAIGSISLLGFIGVFIGKEWYKSLLKIIKKK